MTLQTPSPHIRIAIVVSAFNPEITGGLLRGARGYLAQRGVDVADDDVVEAPGTFELTLIAQALARSGRYDGVVCLGCVIKGDTAHFEFISLGASQGLMSASLATGIPITFGVLTTYTDEQAEVRSRDNKENKGREASAACLETIISLHRISGSSRASGRESVST
jgi:6,7-dimethyl-8-ribityllumazine synthase